MKITTRQAIQQAIEIAKDNEDRLVVACLYVIEAQYIVGEIGEVAAILVGLAKQKMEEFKREDFPCELIENE